MKASQLRRTRVVLSLTFLATILQFWALDAQSLWYDEGFSVWLSQQSLSEIIARTAADIHPPFYYVLLHGWIALTGSSEWTLRFLSALFAVLSVPLMWQVARRLLRQREAAHTVALLVALSPLWLWYGREVRMYALSLALLAAAALCLLQLLRQQHTTEWKYAAAFALLATVAVYTHFYIWFVVAAWGLVAIWAWGRASLRLPIVAVAFGVPFLAYLPWLGITLRRLAADRSYWEGILPLDEVVDHALASWMTGHSAFEAAATALGWLGAFLATLGALVLLWRTLYPRKGPSFLDNSVVERALPLTHWLFVILWLLVPILGLILLSWDRPKYHPRYLIFAAPAFMLLLGALIGWCWRRSWAGRLVGMLSLLLVVGTFLFADWNLFNNPAFAKADWRGVARYIQQHRQAGEPVLLISGHAYPIFHYYYPSEEKVLYLPAEPTLDTTAVLGLDAGATIAESVQGANHLWIVEWQNEVVDPEGVVPALLYAAGAVPEPTPRYMEVGLSQWRLPETASLEAALVPEQRLNARFGEEMQLLGWGTLPTPNAVDVGLSLMLYWAAQRPLEEDYKVRLDVVDEEGFVYGTWEQRPTSYLHPTFRWQPGEARLATIRVPLQPGTPPGEYWVTLSVYAEGSASNLDVLDEAGAPRGQEVRLGPISLAPSSTGWLGVESPANATLLRERLLDGTELLAARLALPSQLEPGQQVPVTLWWRTAGQMEAATLHLGWERGSTLIENESRRLGAPGWPSERWQADDLLMTPLIVRAPRDIGSGSIRLVAWLSDGNGRESKRVTLANGTIVQGNRTFEAPSVLTPQQARFDDKIRLLGYDLSSDSLNPEEPVTLTLYWGAISEMEQSYKVFAHLLTEDGVIVPGAGQDKFPQEGARLTDSWIAGEFLTDTFQLTLPRDAPPGPYLIEVGWYDASDPNYPRLPASGAGADSNRVLLDPRLTAGR